MSNFVESVIINDTNIKTDILEVLPAFPDGVQVKEEPEDFDVETLKVESSDSYNENVVSKQFSGDGLKTEEIQIKQEYSSDIDDTQEETTDLFEDATGNYIFENCPPMIYFASMGTQS